MGTYRDLEMTINDEFFKDTAYYAEIKTPSELKNCLYVNQEIVMEVFQLGKQFTEVNHQKDMEPLFYIPIIMEYKIGALLLIFQQEKGDLWIHSEIKKRAALAGKYAGKDLAYQQYRQIHKELRVEIKAIFDTITQPFCLIGMDGLIEEINRPFAELLQADRDLLIGEDANVLLKSDQWSRIVSVTKREKVCLLFDFNESELYETIIHPVIMDGTIKSILLVLLESKPIKTTKPTQKDTLYDFNQIKGSSDLLRKTIKVAKRVSESDASVILRGESGTGKELFAQSIHNNSERRNHPFIALNCAAIPENLLESELFGYEKGAFTGAAKDKPGRFEMADKGTIFLDEIGDMSLYLQAKLLRVIQEKTIERVGSAQIRKIDVRIITATHQPLEQLVKEGSFRQDLYYRISVISISIPSLRERMDDLPILIEHFMNMYSRELNRQPKQLSSEVYQVLYGYSWPGNIRELQNVIRHFVELEIGDTVTLKSLPSSFNKEEIITYKSNQMLEQRSPVGRMDKHEIMQCLDQFGWDTEGKRKCALHLGISLPTLYRWMKKMKIR